MSKILIDEATVKLVLEALKQIDEAMPFPVAKLAQAALREALAKPDFWEGYVPEPVKCKYPKCSYPCTDLPDCRDAEQPAQQALDKMAENARELGLDYEPAQQCKWPTCQSEEYQQALAEQIKRELVGEQPAQQEPVAFLVDDDLYYPEEIDWESLKEQGHTVAPLYTSPPAQRTWQGLTDEERKLVRNSVGYNQFVTAGEYAEHVQKATEFKLKEKNNG